MLRIEREVIEREKGWEKWLLRREDFEKEEIEKKILRRRDIKV